MIINHANIDINFNRIDVNPFWNNSYDSELKMHKIHAYPAKFPAFLIKKSLQYAEERALAINNVADIFCGCGTTALEAKQNNLDFWGCDINPVATLIAKVKSQIYLEGELKRFYNKILLEYGNRVEVPTNILQDERIKYWFEECQIKDLFNLLRSIKEVVRPGKYRDFFLCAFSNILKPTSKWLTKSIKPQIDPNKPKKCVLETFKDQISYMLKSIVEINGLPKSKSKTKVETQNFLSKRIQNSIADLLITSPPYVTSYEYADLHQLSTLWLGYVNDYRDLRKGTIGSLYNNHIKEKDACKLNYVGKKIYEGLKKIDDRKAMSAAKYFLDIDRAIEISFRAVNPGGMAVFVIGNTSYGSVKVDNAKYLTKCMLDTGFMNIDVIRREVSSKILTPYRDEKGRFSSDKRRKKVYGDEFIVIGRKYGNA